ncbi:MAG: aldo/keto reductase, partial [Mycobacteriales bacterium]
NLADDVRLLGPSGLLVSPLTLGTMTFGDGGWRAGEDNARAIFAGYLEAGGNCVDTADVYGGGRAEDLLGQFMAATGSSEHLVVATKASAPTGVGPNDRGNTRKHLLAAVEGSLRRLRTDYVDVFWLHLWDGVTPVAEVMATLAQLVADGKARPVGLSNVPAWYATAACALADRHGSAPPVALQLEYSLLERTAETEHVPAAQHCGMSLVPWSPPANGFLTGKYRPTADNAAAQPAGGGGRLAATTGYPDRRTHTDRDWAVLDASATQRPPWAAARRRSRWPGPCTNPPS